MSRRTEAHGYGYGSGRGSAMTKQFNANMAKPPHQRDPHLRPSSGGGSGDSFLYAHHYIGLGLYVWALYSIFHAASGK